MVDQATGSRVGYCLVTWCYDSSALTLHKCVYVCVRTEQAGTRSTSEGFVTEKKKEEGGRANEKVGHEVKKEEKMGGKSCA